MSHTQIGRQNVYKATVSLLEVYLTLLFTPIVSDTLVFNTVQIQLIKRRGLRAWAYSKDIAAMTAGGRLA